MEQLRREIASLKAELRKQTVAQAISSRVEGANVADNAVHKSTQEPKVEVNKAKRKAPPRKDESDSEMQVESSQNKMLEELLRISKENQLSITQLALRMGALESKVGAIENKGGGRVDKGFRLQRSCSQPSSAAKIVRGRYSKWCDPEEPLPSGAVCRGPKCPRTSSNSFITDAWNLVIKSAKSISLYLSAESSLPVLRSHHLCRLVGCLPRLQWTLPVRAIAPHCGKPKRPRSGRAVKQPRRFNM
ncbi:hypothetical protein MRX96_006225 [Rhipicephalus microplus]